MTCTLVPALLGRRAIAVEPTMACILLCGYSVLRTCWPLTSGAASQSMCTDLRYGSGLAALISALGAFSTKDPGVMYTGFLII